MSRSAVAAVALALTFVLAHLAFVPSTLEDIDSVNFALATRDFDVAEHRPHPPGYPVYVGIIKTLAAAQQMVRPGAERSSIEATTMAALSLVASALAIILLYRLLACVVGGGDGDFITPPWRELNPRALAATALTVACPLFWYMAVRPMSDMPGLAAALAAQVCLALAWWRQRPDATGDRRLSRERIEASGRMIVAGALLASVAIGLRSQVAMQTLPLLLLVLIDRVGRGVAGAMIGAAVAGAVGAIAWLIPLFVASGGVDAYLAALGAQAGADFESTEMLYANPGARLAAFALMRTFVYPWESVVLGGIVVALAVIGALALLIRDRRAFVLVATLGLPYLVFHLLLQDTTFPRYALPLVPVTVYLTVCGLEVLARRAALPAAGALALWAIALATPILAAYAGDPSPVARVVRAMRDAGSANPGTLAMHQTFRRPLEAEALPAARQLPSPPRREWLELARHWREGQLGPLWFLADPRRSDLALIDPASRRDRTDFAWRFTSLSDIGGLRPAAVSWYRMPAPGWFAEEGWALTPETAGIARVMGRGPHLGPIVARVRRRADAATMMIGGRHLGAASDPAAQFAVTIDGRQVAAWTTPAGFFLQVFELPAGTLAGEGPWATLEVTSSTGAARIETAIEQFDLQTRGAMMWGYGEGWYESEYDPAVGVWRWTSGRAALRVIAATSPVTVTLNVERSTRYFDQPSSARVVVGDRVLSERTIGESSPWVVEVPLDLLRSADGRIVIETNQTFIPAKRGGVDPRALGLRVFGVTVSAGN